MNWFEPIWFALGMFSGFAMCAGFSEWRVNRRIAQLEKTNPKAAKALADAFEGWEP